MLDLAILGLLEEQPLHGYELKKRLGETLGLWDASFGSLYPALRRLERAGAIEGVDTLAPPAGAPMPPTGSVGSVDGEAAVAAGVAEVRQRHRPKPGRRRRKAYRITPRGHARFTELLADEQQPGTPDDDRAFALKLAFCRHLPSNARLGLLERRRTELSEQLARSRRVDDTPPDRYAQSLFQHQTESIEHDLEWVDELITAERQQLPQLPREKEGATA